MLKKAFFPLLLLATVALLAADLPQNGVVTGKELAIRSKPGLQYEKLGSLLKGDKVLVLAQKDEWYKIELPITTKAWVAADSIDEKGEVLRDRCPLYAGPGVMYTAFAELPRGTKLIKVASSITKWQMVQVPPKTAAWVSSDYVKLDAPPVEPAINAITSNTLKEAENQRKQTEQKIQETEAALQRAEIQLLALQQKLTETQAAAQKAELNRKKMEQKLQEDNRKADAAMRASELAIIKQTSLELETKKMLENPEYQKKVKTLAELEKELADVKAKLDATTKEFQEKKNTAETELNALQAQIKEQKEELLRYPKPTVYHGVVVGLGARATTSATHILYDQKHRPVAFLSSRRIPLNQWANTRVRLSGSIQHPRGWQLPLVLVTDIVTE